MTACGSSRRHRGDCSAPTTRGANHGSTRLSDESSPFRRRHRGDQQRGFGAAVGCAPQCRRASPAGQEGVLGTLIWRRRCWRRATDGLDAVAKWGQPPPLRPASGRIDDRGAPTPTVADFMGNREPGECGGVLLLWVARPRACRRTTKGADHGSTRIYDENTSRCGRYRGDEQRSSGAAHGAGARRDRPRRAGRECLVASLGLASLGLAPTLAPLVNEAKALAKRALLRTAAPQSL
jgi:hypothetical protein